MEIKLSTKDVLELAKAIKSGRLEIDKVERLNSLKENYNPPKKIGDKELEYYLKCLYDGWGYVPIGVREVQEIMLAGLNGEQLEIWKDRIEDCSVYRRLVKDAFFGLMAVKALGGVFTEKEPDFKFMEQEPPKF